MKRLLTALLCLATVSGACLAAAPSTSATASPYAKWRLGPPADPSFFPIAVWLQNPRNADAYRRAGINTYVGLWQGPTEAQVASLKTAGMKLICDMNAYARQHLREPTIVGWMHGDEPDNAQSLGQGKGYGPPILPARIQADYEALRRADPDRPVMLNLGQGVAWDAWYGRGVRTRHPEDYVEYLRGSDIVSFDIYPVAHDHPDVQGKLWFVADGVKRLAGWSGGEKVVWNCIECTRISSERKATPEQVKAEVWMSLIHGSMGLIYFVHEWKPRFNEAALLSDPEMLKGVTAVNLQIQELAPVLNSPSQPGLARVESSTTAVPIATMTKQWQGATYVFAVGMRDGGATGTFTLAGRSGREEVEVLGEGRKLACVDGKFADAFEPWAVHLYRARAASSSAATR